jgi:hypothetical protein
MLSAVSEVIKKLESILDVSIGIVNGPAYHVVIYPGLVST